MVRKEKERVLSFDISSGTAAVAARKKNKKLCAVISRHHSRCAYSISPSLLHLFDGQIDLSTVHSSFDAFFMIYSAILLFFCSIRGTLDLDALEACRVEGCKNFYRQLKITLAQHAQVFNLFEMR